MGDPPPSSPLWLTNWPTEGCAQDSQPGIDTSKPAGKLVYSIIAAVSEMERDLLIERVMSGLAASRARGRKGGRKREFSPAAVRRAQDLYDKGEMSVTEIAKLSGVSRQKLYRYLGARTTS